MMFSHAEISFIKSLIADRNKSLRHEVSDHLDNSLPVKKLKTEIVSATQTSDVSSSTSSLTDLTGATVNVTPGTWLLIASFKSARAWVNFGAGGRSQINMLCQIADSLDNEIERTHTDFSIDGNEDRNEVCPTITTVQTFTEPATLKLRGYVNVASGTDFASGFRIDSAVKGEYATLTAIQLG